MKQNYFNFKQRNLIRSMMDFYKLLQPVSLSILLHLLLSPPAYAITPIYLLDPTPQQSLSSLGRLSDSFLNPLSLFKLFSDSSSYQIGDVWGKIPVEAQQFVNQPHFERMAKSTAKIRSSATAFFIGKYMGQYVMATNHHVCPTALDCQQSGVAIFPFVDQLRATMVEFYGSWKDIDLALFSVKFLDESKIPVMEGLASPFDFESPIRHGQLLTTIGFGIANNNKHVMMGNQDQDCRVYSTDNDFKKMEDPDDFNPADYTTWSFSNGCDVSHGDSGSAMMDRVTGKVVGIIWTGKIPKNEKIKTRDFMDSLFENPQWSEVWKDLSYAVPAQKIKEHLLSMIDSGDIRSEHVPVIRAILDGKSSF